MSRSVTPAGQAGAVDATPRLELPGSWERVLGDEARPDFERLLLGYLATRRWFGGKARRALRAVVDDAVPLPTGAGASQVVLARVEYDAGDPERYLLDLAWCAGEAAARVRQDSPGAVIARLGVAGREGVLYEASQAREFRSALLDAIARGARFAGARGELCGTPTGAFERLAGATAPADIDSSLLGAEQSNTSVRYADRLILKLFRRAEEGVSPDLEISRFLAERTDFRHVPPVAGFLEYRRPGREPVTLGLLQGFVPNQGDAWRHTLEGVARYFERLAGQQERLAPPAPGSLFEAAAGQLPPQARELMAAELEAARSLGQRTAELHLALASRDDDPAFAPEPFTRSYRRSLHQSMRQLADTVWDLLGRRLETLPRQARPDAERVRGLKPAVLKRLRAVLDPRIAALRTRHHGDYHLGQVLWTGRDFVIFDFEGEPARALASRRLKRSPLRDVAGMIRSFHYAAYEGLARAGAGERLAAQESARLEGWAGHWYAWASSAFLRAYLEAAAGAAFLPPAGEPLALLLGSFLLEKAVYELGYELNNRPEWVRLPLRGILLLCAAEHGAAGARTPAGGAVVE